MLSDRYLEAIRYARDVHDGQVRKGTEIPYLAHLVSVSALVVEDGGNEELAIAALLHDAIEDGGGARRERAIRSRFGSGVAMVVRACSDTDEEPKPGWTDRKRVYLEHLRDQVDQGVLRVSAADKLHNARAILADFRSVGLEVFGRFKPSPGETVGYYAVLASIYRELLLDSQLPGELAKTVDAIVAESGVIPLAESEWTCQL